ncbi:MAG: extracellular solute-binding protein [Clostridia bacterium]|nr:extracellular solute-binding protein [Clostridia bacterium]
MKKWLSLLLAALMIMGTAASVSANAQTVLKFWTHANSGWNASWYEMIAAFEAENPDIKVEYTIFPYNDFEAKIQTSLIAGEVGADVYEVWGGWMLDLVDAGALSETPEEFVQVLREDAFAPVLGTLEKDGKIYGAPLEFNNEYGGILVNKRLFEEYGLPYPATWAEVVETAKLVADQDGEIMNMRGLEFAHRDGLITNYFSMILQKGGHFLEENGKLNFNTQEAAEAMSELVALIKDDRVTNLDMTFENIPGVEGHDLICIDECLMLARGPWVISECIEGYDAVLGEDIDFIPQPPFYPDSDIPQLMVSETGWSLCVPKTTQLADAAWRFIEFVYEPENLLRHNINCAQIPPRASVVNEPEYLEKMPYIAPLVALLPNAQFIGSYNTEMVKDYLVQVFGALASDDGTYASVEEALAQLTEDLDKGLKIY